MLTSILENETLVVDWHYYLNLKCEVNFYIIDLDYRPIEVDEQYVLVS